MYYILNVEIGNKFYIVLSHGRATLYDIVRDRTTIVRL